MELLWWSHLVTLLCISSLLSVNYTWLTRCLRDSECEASICERVITLEREKLAGYIVHLHGRMSFNYPLSNHFSPSSHRERPLPGIRQILDEWVWACVACLRRYITILYVSRAIVLLCRWDSLLIVPACRTSVDTDGLYSPRALYECYKSSWIQGLWQRVMNEVYEGIFFLRVTWHSASWNVMDDRHEALSPRLTGALRLPSGCIMSPDSSQLIILC